MFENTYADEVRARAYAQLEFPGTYHLAFRDLPELLGAGPGRALDFGCGAGRSTRFLKGLGFAADGVDTAEAMLAQARLRDPEGCYLRVPEGDLSLLAPGRYDRILAAFTFDNVAAGAKPALFRQLARLLGPAGRLFNLVSSEALYRMEWASFSTAGFPGNREPAAGDLVYTVMKDVPDARPVPDVFCPERDYLALYADAGLRRVRAHRPLGRAGEGFPWVNEDKVAPWRIDVLERRPEPPRAGAFGLCSGPC